MSYFTLFIKYSVIVVLSLVLSIGLLVGWWNHYNQHPSSEAFALSQEWLSPWEYCDKYQYASIKHQQIKQKIDTILARIVSAFDKKYNPQTKIGKYATIITKLNTKISNTESKMVMYVANCAKNTFLQQILKNRSMLEEEDWLSEITKIFLDEYNGMTSQTSTYYAPHRSTLSSLPQGTGTTTETSNTTQTAGEAFGNIYLNSSNLSLWNH